MTMYPEGDDTNIREGMLQKRPEIICSPEITQVSSLSTQSCHLMADRPAGDSVEVINNPNHEELFDLSLLQEMDDNEYTSEILTIFLGDTPKDLNELKRMSISNNYEAVYKMAHKIKGSAGLLQATFFLNVLIKIEETAKAAKNDELINLAELAHEEYKKIELPLKVYLRNIEKELRTSR